MPRLPTRSKRLKRLLRWDTWRLEHNCPQGPAILPFSRHQLGRLLNAARLKWLRRGEERQWRGGVSNSPRPGRGRRVLPCAAGHGYSNQGV